MTKKPGTLVKAGDFDASPEFHFRQPLNPKSDIFLRSLGDAGGLERTALMVGRILPGGESFVYHSHENDEEFLYILSGRARIEIDDQVMDIGTGDFVGFPTPSVAHHLTNPFDDELVYLMGGERGSLDVAHFPRLGKKAVRTSEGFFFVDDDAFQPFDVVAAFPDGIPKSMLPAEDPLTDGPGDDTDSLADRIAASVLESLGTGRDDEKLKTARNAVQTVLANHNT